jgi:protein gp37
MEPLLEKIDLLKEYPVGKGSVPYGALLNWVIAGGESGHGARPSHPDWFRSLRDQCSAAGVPFFMKQWGEWAPDNNGDRCVFLNGNHAPNLEPAGTNGDGSVRISKVGKKTAGRLLDGREHNDMPDNLKPFAGSRV